MSSDFLKTDGGSVINNDLSEYERYKLKRKQAVREKSIEQKVQVLEQEISELKIIVKELQNRLN